MVYNEDYLRRLYYDPENPASFSGALSLYKEANKDQTRRISMSFVKKWLQKQKLYTLNKHAVHNFPRRRTIIPYTNYMMDIDNAYLPKFPNKNKGNKFFLLTIDDFSKKVRTRPIKAMTGKNMVNALKSIFKDMGRLPERIRSDKGSEFVNNHAKRFLKKKGIKHIISQSDKKASFAKRAIQTLKRKLLRVMIAEKTKQWTHLLPKVTESYNRSYHRSIGMAPNKVTDADNAQIWMRMYLPKPKTQEANVGVIKTKKRYKEPRFSYDIGDTVKVSIVPSKFSTAYDKRFSDENFLVADRQIKDGFQLYTLKDMKNEVLLGEFYSQQIQKVKKKTMTMNMK